MKPIARQAGRLVALAAVCTLSLQLYFAARVALMAVVDPQSTSFQRSEAWRLATTPGVRLAWQQRWVDDAAIAAALKRAVIASEDSGFADHRGVEWQALEGAWEKNLKAEARADKLNEQLAQRVSRLAAQTTPRRVEPKVIGGSTISQQLAKNLFLSGERTVLRKGQEFAITFMLEALLSKRRILEIYLNSVEWGEGVFGAEAAARRYFRVDASHLSPAQAARLAVMLPAPKRFEQRPGSPYVAARAATVAARMGAVTVP